MSLGHTVAWRRNAELERYAAAGMNAFPDPLGNIIEMSVSRIDVGLRIDNADQWLVFEFLNAVAGATKKVLPDQTDGKILVIEYNLALGLFHIVSFARINKVYETFIGWYR